MTIGQRVREQRERLGLLQVDLAGKVDWTQGAVSALETGRINPDAKSLVRLADALEVTTDWLLGRKE